MDPDAPQPSDPVAPLPTPPEAPDEGAPPIVVPLPDPVESAEPIAPIEPVLSTSTIQGTAAPRSRASMADLEPLSAAKRRMKKEANKARILALAEKKGHFKISDIELHLLIPKRTAEEYVKELMAEGRLDRRGDVDSTEYWPIG